jgi:Leucine-rich repeat (LRR) protein
LTDASVSTRTFYALHSLDHLNVASNSLTNFDALVTRLTMQVNTLTHLDAALNGIAEWTSELNFPILHTLRLNDNRLRQIHTRAFMRATHVKRLLLFGNRISEWPALLFHFIRGLEVRGV